MDVPDRAVLCRLLRLLAQVNQDAAQQYMAHPPVLEAVQAAEALDVAEWWASARPGRLEEEDEEADLGGFLVEDDLEDEEEEQKPKARGRGRPRTGSRRERFFIASSDEEEEEEAEEDETDEDAVLHTAPSKLLTGVKLETTTGRKGSSSAAINAEEEEESGRPRRRAAAAAAAAMWRQVGVPQIWGPGGAAQQQRLSCMQMMDRIEDGEQEEEGEGACRPAARPVRTLVKQEEEDDDEIVVVTAAAATAVAVASSARPKRR